MSDLIALRGLSHYKALERLHSALKPTRYFEIGTQNGGTLCLSNCRSVAVDPAFRLTTDVITTKPAALLFQQTSDRFFSENNLSLLLGGPIDLAFLDGLHLYEYLLRDFINTEKSCSRNSVIAVHDCIPPDRYVARRQESDRLLSSESEHPKWWSGDVWKVLPILKQYRPDLDVTILDSVPTGLVLITNLNPKSNVLADSYFEICREWSEEGKETLEGFLKTIVVKPTSLLTSIENIGPLWF
jgi:hypothetical protein